MRRKVILAIVTLLAVAGFGYLAGSTVLIAGLIAFGLGFLVGRRQRGNA